ncbi:MAG: CHASE2 domain-containing protein [Muribaculaceae bacterium]|nr:CHASE2 domain-containing protein [Muribaculaceae bacterium]
MATLLGLFLSTCLVQPLSMTTSAMFSSPDKRDFQLPDLFAQIANNRPVRKYDDRIVILNIGRSNREEIAEALSILSLCGPKAVGIDINFAHPSDDDSFLLEAIHSLPNAILPLGVSSTKKNGVFEIEEKPFFYDDYKDLEYGVVNLPTAAKGTVREFAIDFPTTQGTLPSFVTALAEKLDPSAVEELRERGEETGITSYHSREYNILDFDDIEEHAEDFADKIVLVGALEDAGDMHATPVESHVAGVMLHASALSTILDRIWIQKLPKSVDYALAMGLCLGIMLLVFGIKTSFKGFVLRIVQASLAYLAVRIGYGLFVDHNIIFDISFTITIIAFGLFAVDIWNFLEAIWKICSKKIAKFDAKFKTI